MELILYMGGWSFYKREPQTFIPAKTLFTKYKIDTALFFDGSHYGRMDFISFERGAPLCKRKPQSCIGANAILYSEIFIQ